MADSLPIKFGRQLITRIANPAANTEFTYAPSTRLIEMLYSVNFTLVTDANAATRQVLLTISDPTGVIQRIGTNTTQSVTLTRQYQCSYNTPNFQTGNTAPITSFFPMPSNLIIPLGGTVDSLINATQAGDQISAIIIITYVWIRT